MPTNSQHFSLQEAFQVAFTQAEVDFVVPDLAIDRPLCIDPFLLYKSKDVTLRALHDQLLALFQRSVEFYSAGRRDDLNALIDFPEVNEIGFGYTDSNIQGSGLGQGLNRVLAEILGSSAALRARGIRHIEELQLLSPGIGPDRISDIAANVLKQFLVSYTQKQAELWGLPITSGVPLHHYFDFEAWEWADGYFDLPQNPISGLPILLVPRRIVRQLPWINYNDYVRTDFKLYLRATRPKRKGPGATTSSGEEPTLTKQQIIGLTRQRLDVLDGYVLRKEREAPRAEPGLSPGLLTSDLEYRRGEEFLQQLNSIPTGAKHASVYQRLVLEILNYLFEPDLTDGQLEVSTHLGTERRDIIFVNEADTSFWNHALTEYGSYFVMFEVKNTQKVEISHVNQAAEYLGVRLGMLGFIVSRHAVGANITQKLYTVYNNTPSTPRKVVLVLCDEDLMAMIRLKQAEKLPVHYIRNMYREFMQKVQ